MKTKFFIARVTKASLEAYRALSTRPDDSGGDYEYCGFSLEEVAVLAKKRKIAFKECMDRSKPLLIRAANAYSSRMRCSMLEVYPYVEKALRKAVEKYNPALGEFSHLLGRIIHLTLVSFGKVLAVHRRRFLTGLSRLEYICPKVITLQDAVGRSPMVSYRLDLNAYLDLLDRKERSILHLYDYHHNFREIGDHMSLSATAVADKVSVMLNELRNRKARMLI